MYPTSSAPDETCGISVTTAFPEEESLSAPETGSVDGPITLEM